MDAATATLLQHLFDDRPRPGSDPAETVQRHGAHRGAGHAGLVGRLVLPDTGLVAHSRALVPGGPAADPWPVTVDVTGGAGGVAALAGREVSGLRVAAVQTTLRDLDDLPGNVARISAAARGLEDVEVFVELPGSTGWVRAVEAVEAAGLQARVRAGDPVDAETLARRLSVLVEADLPFAITLDPGPGRPGLTVLALAMLVEALVDGAEPAEAAALLVAPDAGRVRAGLDRWDEATALRVRRRLRAVSTDVGAAVADLVSLGVLSRGGGTAPS